MTAVAIAHSRPFRGPRPVRVALAIALLVLMTLVAVLPPGAWQATL